MLGKYIMVCETVRRQNFRRTTETAAVAGVYNDDGRLKSVVDGSSWSVLFFSVADLRTKFT